MTTIREYKLTLDVEIVGPDDVEPRFDALTFHIDASSHTGAAERLQREIARGIGLRNGPADPKPQPAPPFDGRVALEQRVADLDAENARLVKELADANECPAPARLCRWYDACVKLEAKLRDAEAQVARLSGDLADSQAPGRIKASTLDDLRQTLDRQWPPSTGSAGAVFTGKSNPDGVMGTGGGG